MCVCFSLSASVLPVLLGLPVVAQAESNLLQNGGFEECSEGKPTDWDAVETTFSLVQSDVRSGAQAARVKTVPRDSHFLAELRHTQPMKVRHDDFYLASVWAKGGGRLRIVLQQYGEKGWAGGCSSIHTDMTDRWTQYRFYYGAPDGNVDRVQLYVYIDGKDAVALLDDVVFERIGPSQPLGPNAVPNGDMEKDVDDNGVPDDWSVGRPLDPGDHMPTVGIDGSRALVRRCSRPLRAAAGSPDAAKWWDWRSQPVPTAGFTIAAATGTFAVEPGRTYRICFQTSGRQVRVFHTKLWWMTDENKPIKWFTIGPRHDGDWDWEQVSLDLTVPSAHVHAARIEFWCLAAGGLLWVDNVSVRPSRSRAAGWVAETYDVKPLGVNAGISVAEEDDTAVRSSAPVRIQSTDRSRVAATEDGIDLWLTSGVELRFDRREEGLLGIGRVAIGGLSLHNPNAPPIAPLVETKTGGQYRNCRYLGHKVADTDVVTIRMVLESADGHGDHLDWEFHPIVRGIAGREYAGFAYRYTLRAETETIVRVDDRATWELAGDPIGVTVVAQNAYNVTNVFTLTPNNTHCGSGGKRFAGADGLDYQFATEGGLAVFYDEPIAYVDHYRAGSPRWIRYRDSVPFAGVREARTPLKCVLFSERGDHDEWTRVRDYVYDRHAGFWGIQQHTPMPMVNCWMHWKELAKHGDRILCHIADEVLPQVAELGFKVLAVHSVWGHGGCGLDFIEPGEKFGGAKALKHLCDKAAGYDMIVQAWAPAAHLWEHSPLLEEHPDWLIQGPNGQPPTTYCYPTIRGVRFRAGWADYALGQWKKIRDQTGLGSLWVDSYANFTHHIRTQDARVPIEQAEELLRFHAALSQLGYVVYTESTGTFGIVAPGFPVANLDTPIPTGPDPTTRYGVSGYVGHRGHETQDRAVNDVITRNDYYYRSLANKSPPWICWPACSKTPDRHAAIAQANHDYNEVFRWMQYRHTLADDRGVMWSNSNEGTRILFSYRSAHHQFPDAVEVHDITDGSPIEIEKEGFTTKAMHTYRMVSGGPHRSR